MGFFAFLPGVESGATTSHPPKKHRSKKKSSAAAAAAALPSRTPPPNRTPTTPSKQQRTPSPSPSKHHHHKQTKRNQKQKPSKDQQQQQQQQSKPDKHKHHTPLRPPPTPAAAAAAPPPPPSSSWDQFKNLLTCKQMEGSRVHDPSKPSFYPKYNNNNTNSSSSCGSMCSFRDVVHGNTRVVHRSDSSNSPESTGRLLTGTNNPHHHLSSSSRSLRRTHAAGAGAGANNNNRGGGGMPLRKLSGCYECHMIVDPSRYPIIPRATLCSCPQCGEIFPKIESLEHHQAVKHAVSELGPEDSGRNIVEIIFKSSWMKKDAPIYRIERILKVHNTPRTVQRFEDCRDAVKARATTAGRKNPRCAADGNELLRFHCTSLACALGARGASSLCGSVPACGVCTIIRHGFQGSKGGVTTTASSGRAHDSLDTTTTTGNRRAMLVCRVIAGRVRRNNTTSAQANNDNIAPDHHHHQEEDEDDHEGDEGSSCYYDSMAGSVGAYANLEELSVFNPKAILPCFVVIYRTLLDNNLNLT